MKLFGTDGVRGVAGSELSAELALKIGVAAGRVLASSQTKVAIIGRDTRISGMMLESAIAAGLMSEGYRVISLGVVPTPAVAKLVEIEDIALGVMISASHNPYEFNGIKLFSNTGYKLSDDVEEEIEALIEAGISLGDKVGTLEDGANLVERYEELIKDVVFREKTGLEGISIALDAANGSLYQIAERVLTDLGATVSAVGNIPNGENINRNVGSTHLDTCKNYTLHNRADIGLSFDGDGDRLLVCDENGDEYDGDYIMFAIAQDLKAKGYLTEDALVATVMSNLGLEIACKNAGIKLIRTKVGDRYISEEMQKNGYSIGGEQSGHVILSRYATTGDGLLTAVYLLTILKKSGKRASEVLRQFVRMPQTMVNIEVPNKIKYSLLDDEHIAEQIRLIEERYSGRGRVVIRPSGTEPLVRIMLEGEDQNQINADSTSLAGFIRGRLSAMNIE